MTDLQTAAERLCAAARRLEWESLAWLDEEWPEEPINSAPAVDPAMVELVRTAADATFGPHPKE